MYSNTSNNSTSAHSKGKRSSEHGFVFISVFVLSKIKPNVLIGFLKKKIPKNGINSKEIN